MKKTILVFFILSSTLQNIWDNLYSNTTLQNITKDLPQNIKAYLEFEESYLFSSVNIAFDIAPIQNKFYLNLLYNEVSIGQLLINFNKQTFTLYSKKRGCFRTKLPSIFKLNLGNIHNLWKFSTFNTQKNQYEVDLKFLGMDRTKTPETILTYHENDEGKQILKNVTMMFITQKMTLVNKLNQIDDQETAKVFGNELDESQFCVDFSFKQIRKKFADVFLSDLINKIYEKLIGYQNKFMGKENKQEEDQKQVSIIPEEPVSMISQKQIES